MNSSRRWLFIFAIVISVLVIATVSLVLFTKGRNVALLPEDSPEGTVQRYLIAIQNNDYQKAFSFLSLEATSGKISSYNDWILTIGAPLSSGQSVWKATLGKIVQNGNNSNIEVTIDTFRTGGLFGDSQNSQTINFLLIKTDNSWFITSPTYLYWIY